MPWVRPSSVPVGQVWLRFKGKERDGRPAQMYQIRDLEEKRRKECLDLMQKQFLRDEPLCRAFGILSDPVSIATIRANWESYADMHVCLACYTEVDGQPDEVVGFNILYVRSRDDSVEDLSQVQGEPWKKLLNILVTTESLVDIFDHYSVDQYLSDSGLVVSEAHRGQKIGVRLLEARKPLLEAMGLQAVSTVFTAKSSQEIAKRCGYELLGVLPYKQALDPEDMSAVDTPFSELRGYKYSFDVTDKITD